MLKPALTTLALLSTLLATSADGAEPGSLPRLSSRAEQFIWIGDGLQVVERARRAGEVAASFMVEARPVPSGYQVVFEVVSIRESERISRWRCVAVKQLGECFPEPVWVGFHAKDELLRLEVTATDPYGEAANDFRLAAAQ